MTRNTRFARRWFQFSIQTLLFLTLCVCGLLAGYRAGHAAGYRSGLEQGRWQLEQWKEVTRTYYVGDLVSYSAASMETDAGARRSTAEAVVNFEPLIKLLKMTIPRDSWDDVGGPGSIQEFELSLSIAVNQTVEDHQKIDDFLEWLRRDKRRVRQTIP